MSDRNPAALETDDRFPSGSWTGYFLQRLLDESKRQMEMHLSFINGRVMGTGRDGIGAFSIVGRYDIDEGKVTWVKKYAHHDVFYNGFAESNGIWGTWDIPQFGRDGFRIWPKGHGEGSQAAEREEAPPQRITFDDEPIESDTMVGASEKETVFAP
jgi:hypothetical protein